MNQFIKNFNSKCPFCLLKLKRSITASSCENKSCNIILDDDETYKFVLYHDNSFAIFFENILIDLYVNPKLNVFNISSIIKNSNGSFTLSPHNAYNLSFEVDFSNLHKLESKLKIIKNLQ